MNRIWEQNKPLIIVLGACALVLIVVRPNVFSAEDPPLARWLWRSWGPEYEALKTKKEELLEENKEFAPGPGRDRISHIQSRLEVENDVQRQRFEQRVRQLAFVPYAPFLPPGAAGDEPGFYFRRQLTNTRDQLLLYCSLRSVDVAEDLGLAEYEKGAVPDAKLVPGLLRQLAVADTFVKLCADHQVKYTRIVDHHKKRVLGTKGRKGFLWEYPMTVELRAGIEAFADLLRAMKGRRVRVRSVKVNQLEQTVQGVWLDAGSEDGIGRDEEFVIFRQPAGHPCALEYVARVRVTNDPLAPKTPAERDDVNNPNHPTAWREQSFAKIHGGPVGFERFRVDAEKADALRGTEYEVDRYYGTTGFLRVVKLEVTGRPGRIKERNDDGIPTEVIPHRLEVRMDVSTFDFDPKTRHVTAENVDRLTGGRLRPAAKKKKGPTVRRVRTW
ncbi:MAG: hypothetical protein R6V58_01725 [Planctomycetota bacterium]